MFKRRKVWEDKRKIKKQLTLSFSFPDELLKDKIKIIVDIHYQLEVKDERKELINEKISYLIVELHCIETESKKLIQKDKDYYNDCKFLKGMISDQNFVAVMKD